ncbi:hypothetical protein GCK32_016099 [Trichostrongylus colubriformis]|uniref:SXP/RAL-2 family protein Ani s 5-like cation-binding domain-containing protein n=1 Tax=Trichostrongylus colubriformis TaxID=6319 RepID=A0AAN8FXS0_TRICO
MTFWSRLLIQLFFVSTVAAHGCPFLEELLHPPFLKNVSLKAEKEYDAIFFDESLSVAELKKEIMSWAKEYNVTEQVHDLFNRTKKRMEDMKKNVTKLINDLPAALQRFTGILENENQTLSGIKQSLKALKEENPPVGSQWTLVFRFTAC